MITIDDKLYITKEVNHILYDYANKIILRDLLYQYSFGNDSKTDSITELLENTSYYNGDTPPPEEQLQLMELIDRFIKELTTEKRVSLNFWALNNMYSEYLNDPDVQDQKDQSDKEFGRSLAYKLYDQKDSGLEDDLHRLLKSLLITFSSELDLSLIDKDTSENIVEAINNYCDHEGSIIGQGLFS